jgi:hypothetical protein
MRVGMINFEAIRDRWVTVGSKLDERGRRVFAAMEVRAAGWGGLEVVSQIAGLARSTIGRGLKDLDAEPPPNGRVRREGGGRRHLSSTDPTHLDDLKRIVEPAARGDPMRPLLWVSKSHEKPAIALQGMGHKISATSVCRLLPKLEFCRQANRKADEGSRHPDRNAQFEHINAKVIATQAARHPVISVDTTGLTISVCHYPLGTSKWNKIEHRLFCHITQNWRARPLIDRIAVVELIAATTTKTGLRVEAALDTRTYEKGKKVSKSEMRALNITGDPFHPEWNYTIRPRSPPNRSS